MKTAVAGIAPISKFGKLPDRQAAVAPSLVALSRQDFRKLFDLDFWIQWMIMLFLVVLCSDNGVAEAL